MELTKFKMGSLMSLNIPVKAGFNLTAFRDLDCFYQACFERRV